MSILNKPNRVTFDPNKKTHREAVRRFMRRNAWSDSPILFTYDPAYDSVSEQVQIKTLVWFLEREECRTKPKAVPMVEIGDKELAFAMAGIASEFRN